VSAPPEGGPGEGAPPIADLDALYRYVVELVAVAPTPPCRIELRAGTASLEIEWPSGTPTGVPTPPAPDAGHAEDHDDGEHGDDGALAITSPLVGTFYRRPGPDAPPFVEIGSAVTAGQQVGIVEAMKLMNAIEAEADGTICEILVADGASVQFGQTLMRFRPGAPG
jgi:acetyl-CoA carboxylase biotin carboxyl carrier protein